MKQKHLYALLDTTYTTIGVVFGAPEQMAPAAPSAPAAPLAKGTYPHRTERAAPWAQRSDNADASQYGGRRAYTYKVPKDAGVKVDDYVVVHSATRGLSIGQVVRVDENPQIDVDASFEYKWIVQRIDREGYQARVEAERVFGDAMLNIERVRARDEMLRGFHDTLPEGTEARALFDQTVKAVGGGPTINQPKQG